MGVTSIDVANMLVQMALDEGIPINLVKLQRLIYILYKEYLKASGKSLFIDDFEAWTGGWVLRSVYDRYSIYGTGCITKVLGNTVVDRCSSEIFYNTVARVWTKYKYLSGIELSRLVRVEGGAWDKAVKAGVYISNDNDIVLEGRFIR